MTINKEYFRELLQDFFDTYEPHLANDIQEIEYRVESAYSVYNSFADQNSNTHNTALELAKIILFERLDFSTYYFVLELVGKHKRCSKLPRKLQHEMCVKVLPSCLKIYKQYSSTIKNENAYYLMVEDMQKVIKKYNVKKRRKSKKYNTD